MNIIAMIAGYTAISLTLSFVGAFAWFTLKDNQAAKARRKRLAAQDELGDFPEPIILHLSFARRMAKKRPKVDSDIKDILSQIERQH